MKALLLIYAAGSYIDYLTTAWAIPRGAVEQNPLAAHLIAEHGVGALLEPKLIAIVVMCFAMLATGVSDRITTKITDEQCGVGHWLAFITIWVMTLGQWLVVAHNLGQMVLR